MLKQAISKLAKQRHSVTGLSPRGPAQCWFQFLQEASTILTGKWVLGCQDFWHNDLGALSPCWFVSLDLLHTETPVWSHFLILYLNIRTINTHDPLTQQTVVSTCWYQYLHLSALKNSEFPDWLLIDLLGLTLVTRSKTVPHQSWVVRCFPRALEFK